MTPASEVPPTPRSSLVSDDQAWAIVDAHLPLIRRLVDAGIHRLNIPHYQREDLIHEGKLIAHKLAKRHDPTRGEFSHYLSATLSRELRFDPTHDTDAMDRAGKVGLEEMPEVAEPSTPAMATSADSLEARIEKLRGAYRAIAYMAFIEHRSIGIIARRTGRSRHWLQNRLVFLERVLEVS